MLAQLPADDRRRAARARRRDAAIRRPADPVRRRLAADAGRQGRSLSRSTSTREAPAGLYGYQPDPATAEFPLALISPASERTISSTLAELPRPEVRLLMHPDDAAARGLTDGDAVRIFNALGEVRCNVRSAPGSVRARSSLPKGLWRKHTANGYTANALAPDTLTDLGGGACFNDARVQVERAVATAPHGYGPRPAEAGRSVTEEEDQIEPAALDAPELHALRAARRLRRPIACSRRNSAIWYSRMNSVACSAPKPWRSRKNSFSPTCSPTVRLGPAPVLALRLDLELVELERVADRPRQARRQVAAGQRAGALGERDLLPFAELVDRHVEDDQRQDVGLVERRVAAERQLGLPHRALHADERLDAGDDAARAQSRAAGRSRRVPAKRMRPSRRISKRRPWNV